MNPSSVATTRARRPQDADRPAAAAGAQGTALAPPRYGIAFADQPAGASAQVVQRQAEPGAGSAAPAAGRGMPAGLRSGIESLSGVSLDGVRVHYDSPLPGRIAARAYAQGADIHVGPGHERQLAHEAWHVVQQRQGRVGATGRTPDGVGINDDPALEQEAERMGARALAAPRLEARTDEEDLPPEQPTVGGGSGPAADGPLADSTAFQLADLPSASDDSEQQAEKPRAEGGVAQRVGGPPTTFPSFASILASPTVQFQVHKAWLETLAACTPTSRREQGFWITWNSNWGSFSTTGAATGPAVGPAVGATINLPAKPADAHPTYTVASFHTHTPTTFRTVGRAVGPSGADVTADTSDNVAGIVYDFWGDGSGNLPAGRSRAWPARLYKSRNRRT